MLKTYIDLISQPSRAVYLFLKYANIPHTVVPVALRKGEQLTEEYTKINPFQIVPAIDDDGFKLNESVAIMTYLSDKYCTNDKLYPKDLMTRARIDAFMNWHHTSIRFSTGLIFANLVKNALAGKEYNTAEIEFAAKRLKPALNTLENVFLKETPFIYSDWLTIADISAVTVLVEPNFTMGLDTLKDRPKLITYVDSVRDAIGPQLFDEANKVIERVGEVFKTSGLPTPKL